MTCRLSTLLFLIIMGAVIVNAAWTTAERYLSSEQQAAAPAATKLAVQPPALRFNLSASAPQAAVALCLTLASMAASVAVRSRLNLARVAQLGHPQAPKQASVRIP
jgi:hypothetical protein